MVRVHSNAAAPTIAPNILEAASANAFCGSAALIAGDLPDAAPLA